MNEQQNLMIISSAEDGVYIDMQRKQEIDLDDKFNIGCIKEIIHDQEDRVFYILANKYDEKLGFFLIKMSESDTNKFSFLTKYKNKLDIGDATVSVLRDREKGYKELVLSYKTIYINTYNVHVMDISQEGQPTLYKHESFQLWESESRGLLLQNRGDFLKLSKAGAEIIALGSMQKRELVDDLKNDRIVHSLESVNYLKIDPENFITFECADENKIISVYQEYEKEEPGKKDAKDGSGNEIEKETDYDKIFSIKLHEITLRELLLFKSLYVSKTQSDIVQLVKDQPSPLIFYKSSLEFDGTNLASVLSFDSRSMAALLGDDNQEHFSAQFPIFYLNKINKTGSSKKYFYRTAIDRALKANQVRAVSLMIDYIIKN